MRPAIALPARPPIDLIESDLISSPRRRRRPDGEPCAYVTRNGGRTWRRQDAGLPGSQAWWTVKRQAMAADALDPVGLYFGTTSGELWTSRNEGERWTRIAQHLPEIYAVETAELR